MEDLRLGHGLVIIVQLITKGKNIQTVQQEKSLEYSFKCISNTSMGLKLIGYIQVLHSNYDF